jgi:Spy/CpxP family protein refolding chaperone
MKSRIRLTALRAGLAAGLATVGVLGFAAGVLAHPGGGPPERGGMCGGGHGMGPGGGGDMMQIHALFASRDQIRRTVTQIPRGVRATTESDNPAVVAQLREHVKSMYARLKDKQPINARDPLFAAIFQNADKIQVEIEETPKGLTVTETSDDPAVVKLVRRHADVVSLFLKNGMPEMMRAH